MVRNEVGGARGQCAGVGQPQAGSQWGSHLICLVLQRVCEGAGTEAAGVTWLEQGQGRRQRW